VNSAFIVAFAEVDVDEESVSLRMELNRLLQLEKIRILLTHKIFVVVLNISV